MALAQSDVAVGDGLASRLFGRDPASTSVAVSQHAFSHTSTAVLARDDAYADGLAGAPLAGERGGPLLLNPSDHLDPLVAGELRRLGVTSVDLLGGPAALSPAVEAELRASGYAVNRVAGQNRFGTAAAIATLLPGHSAYLAEGIDADPQRGWPDAVAVSALAAQQHRMILLVTQNAIPRETQTVLNQSGVQSVSIIGGTAAVSDAVAIRLRSQGRSVERIAGTTRYATSVAVAERSERDGMDARNIVFTPGATWVESLVAGASSAATGDIVLTVSDAAPPDQPVTAWLDAHRDNVERITAVADPASVSPATVLNLTAHVGSPTAR
jgi:hypothetical protein